MLTETMTVVKTTYGEKLFIVKRRVVGTCTHRNCNFNVYQQYVTKIGKKHFEVYNYKVSCPMSVPFLSISKCQSVLKYLSLCTTNSLYLHDSYISPNSSSMFATKYYKPEYLNISVYFMKV